MGARRRGSGDASDERSGSIIAPSSCRQGGHGRRRRLSQGRADGGLALSGSNNKLTITGLLNINGSANNGLKGEYYDWQGTTAIRIPFVATKSASGGGVCSISQLPIWREICQIS